MNTNKKILGITIGLFIFMMIISIGCDSSTSTNTNITESSTIETETKIVTSVKPSESITVEPSHTPKKTTKKVVKKVKVEDFRLDINTAIVVLKDSYKGVAKVEKEGRVIKITCYDTNFAYEVLDAKDGNKEKLAQWKSIEKSLKETSENIESDIMISIMNPLNTDNTLLTIMDGITIYNFVK